MKTAEETLIEIVSASGEGIMTDETSPLKLSVRTCIKAMEAYANQSRWISVDEMLREFDELTEMIGAEAYKLERGHGSIAAYSHCYIELLNWRNKWKPLPPAPNEVQPREEDVK